MIKTIIWDFNGTIIDDVDVAVKILNSILKELEYNILIDKDTYKDLFTFPVIEYYKNVGIDYNKHSFELVANLYHKYYNKYMIQAKINKHFYTLVDYFKSLGYKNVIISATREDILKKEISNYELNDYFDEIYGINDIYAHSKKDIANNWNNTSKLAKYEKIYIGDTVHDYEVANLINSKPYIICSGHQSKKILENNNIKTYKDLMEVKACLE